MRWIGIACGMVLVAAGLVVVRFRGENRSEREAPRKSVAAWFAAMPNALASSHDPGPIRAYPMPQIVGSGAALFDADGDGRLDVLLLQNGGPQGAKNLLFLQQSDGSFADRSEGSGLDVAGFNMGAAVGDIDNDGRPDVLVTQFGGLKLFRNLGGGKFADVSEEAGVRSRLWGTSASFFDYDRDGWLDFVVANYVDYDPSWPCISPSGEKDYCHPKVFGGTVTKLFRNLGGAGRLGFEETTIASGLAKIPGPGLGVMCADFDGDGWPDIFVANDGQPNRLWINRHDGTFVERAAVAGIACNHVGEAQAGMGIAYGDVDGDGLADVFVTHLTQETHTFWKQGPRGLFQDRTSAVGLTHSHWRGTGFGAVMADFNQDGWLDIAVANGRVAKGETPKLPALGPHWSAYGERNQLFANDGTGRFLDRSEDDQAFCGIPNVARGLACGDIDGDGAPDLLVTAVGSAPMLLKNIVPRRGRFLWVRAFDPRRRRDAYGAEVTLRVGRMNQVRLIQPGHSFLSSSDPRAHFGLGDAEAYDAIEVLWPDGLRETFPGGTADAFLELRRGSGKSVPATLSLHEKGP